MNMPTFSIDGLRIDTDPHTASASFLGWDTEGGTKWQRNLLRNSQPLVLRINTGAGSITSATMPVIEKDDVPGGVRYRLKAGENTEIDWLLQVKQGAGLVIEVAGRGLGLEALGAVEILFPFDPAVTCTTALSAAWEQDKLLLPAVVNAPDFGPMLLRASADVPVQARLEGDRDHKIVDLIVELPKLKQGKTTALQLRPANVPPPAGLKDLPMWRQARRGWINGYQATARWGAQDRPFSSPAGLLGNNVISDPASCSLWMYADMMLLAPQIDGVQVANMIRRTADYWLQTKMHDSGEVICYWNYTDFLDSNAGPIIAAWDYVEATGDIAWLTARIPLLEKAAGFLARRDVDGDGMVEATQSGNPNTLQQPRRSCAWFDGVNCGHKEGYTNALIYRAWCCLAELEKKLGRSEPAARYAQLAAKLKKVYASVLMNPKTGWLGWWRSADGNLHDYGSPFINGMAICFGLIDPNTGRDILRRLHAKMKDVGFTRFDLGVPTVLRPIRQEDYIQPSGNAAPHEQDGHDTFEYYMNGGITPAQVLEFIVAHYVVGLNDQGDMILKSMLDRQNGVGFQNGAVNEYPKGIDWTTWTGQPAGYEGYLADEYRFLMAVPLREAAIRAKFYRPMFGQP
jgi:hypothetical protein